MSRALVLSCLIACAPSGSGAEETRATPELLDANGKSVALPLPVLPDCASQQRLAAQNVRGMYVAKNPFPHQRAAVAATLATSPVCRNGAWYLSVAHMMDRGVSSDLASLGLDSAEAALNAALLQQDDPNVLARAAQVVALGRHVRLPPDACARARHALVGLGNPASARDRPELQRATDSTHYVCARAAIAERDGTSASSELDEIADRPADFELARAQISELLHDPKGVIRNAKAAIERMTRRDYSLLTTADRDAIIRLAEPLTASTRATSP